VFSTLVGSGNLAGMVVDPNGEPIVAANYGSGIPVTSNAYSTATTGESFLVKVSADGSKALYGSYFAPNGKDAGVLIAGISGNVWISNQGSNSVTRILGGAAPAAPLANAVTNDAPATRP
jgi:hypothetical protein